MAQPGDILTNPAVGKLLFRQTASSTNGGLLEMEVTYHPHSAPPSAHYHPLQREHFTVVSGIIRAQVGDVLRQYGAGDQFSVPPGVSHWMFNPDDKEATVIWQVWPALNTETLFETLWGLAAEGKTSANGSPKLLQAAVIGQTYHREFRLTRPSYRVMRVIIAILAPLGRLLGYKAVYPQYSPSAP